MTPLQNDCALLNPDGASFWFLKEKIIASIVQNDTYVESRHPRLAARARLTVLDQQQPGQGAVLDQQQAGKSRYQSAGQSETGSARGTLSVTPRRPASSADGRSGDLLAVRLAFWEAGATALNSNLGFSAGRQGFWAVPGSGAAPARHSPKAHEM